MQKVSIKKLSLLGLVLIAASAAASAFMPKEKTPVDCNGFVTVSSDIDGAGDATCSEVGNDERDCYTITNNDGSSSGTRTNIVTNKAATKGSEVAEPCNTI